MMIELSQFQSLCNTIQLVACHSRQHALAEYQCIQCCELKCDMISLADIADKRSIEIGVVCCQNRIFTAEFNKLPHCFYFFGSIFYHGIRNTCQFHDLCRNRSFRIYHGVECFHHLHATHTNCTNFCQAVIGWTQAGCFHIKNNDFVLQCSVFWIINYQ